MRPILFGALIALAMQLVSTLAPQGAPVAIGPRMIPMYVVAAPWGFYEFCQRMPMECRSEWSGHAFEPSPDQTQELATINSAANSEIEPVTDMELYGVSEFWTIPTFAGDCEDVALLKRQRLMQRGWPASALLMTVVRDEKGEGHAVLTASTANGDFILDGATDEVKLWSDVAYEFIMRQSKIDPHIWVSIAP